MGCKSTEPRSGRLLDWPGQHTETLSQAKGEDNRRGRDVERWRGIEEREGTQQTTRHDLVLCLVTPKDP